MKLQGGCLCGGMRYEIDGPFTHVDNCHCSMCRRFHGAAFSTYAEFDVEHFRWLEGQDLLAVYETSPGIGWAFCRIAAPASVSQIAENSAKSLWGRSTAIRVFAPRIIFLSDPKPPGMRLLTRCLNTRRGRQAGHNEYRGMWQVAKSGIDVNTERWQLFSQAGHVLAFAEVVQHWRGNAEFRILEREPSGSPVRRLLLGMPADNRSKFIAAIRVVFVSSPMLAKMPPDPGPFSGYFRPDCEIVSFESLGKDAWLVAPCPGGQGVNFSHLASSWPPRPKCSRARCGLRRVRRWKAGYPPGPFGSAPRAAVSPGCTSGWIRGRSTTGTPLTGVPVMTRSVLPIEVRVAVGLALDGGIEHELRVVVASGSGIRPRSSRARSRALGCPSWRNPLRCDAAPGVVPCRFRQWPGGPRSGACRPASARRAVASGNGRH